MEKHLAKRISTSCFILVMGMAGPAYGVQQHGGAEGLVSHQIGHILFITGMVYLLYRIYHNRIAGTGWFEFKAFLWLIILWNILTFSGHWMQEIIDPARFLRQGAQIKEFVVAGPFGVLFYLTSLDHLLLVPSFLFLLAALQKWRRIA